MEKLRINETPVRTSRNFLINNIEVELEMPEKIAEFKNVQIIKETSNIEKDASQTKESSEAKIENNTSNEPLTYGIGKIVEHKEYGEQFKVDSFEKLMPQTLEALERYLGNGTIKGVGPATARKIVRWRIVMESLLDI